MFHFLNFSTVVAISVASFVMSVVLPTIISILKIVGGAITWMFSLGCKIAHK